MSISILTALPLIAGIILFFSRPLHARKAALFCSLGILGGAFLLLKQFNPGNGAIQLVEKHAWIPAIHVDYFVGVDGLSMVMLLLGAALVPFCIASVGNIERPQLYFGLIFLLEAAFFGVFTALNFFHWFLFWELSLVPAFILIKLWGGERRGLAALQFFIYTFIGSVPMLLSFLAIYLATSSFDFMQLAELSRKGELVGAISQQITFGHANTVGMIIFFGVFLGLAVKVPLMPFHSWLPLAYSEANSSTSMLLTGILSKMGLYGCLRILIPIFPQQMQAIITPLLIAAVATIILSAYAAWAQKDLKKIIAYSSINHLGYCLLGIFALVKFGELETARISVLNGVVLQMVNHGITASALFCFAGYIERRTGGSRSVDAFGGLRKAAPIFAGLMGISIFSSLGLPGLNGFVGEYLIFSGAFALAPVATGVAAIGLLVTAIFLLGVIQKVFAGPLDHKWNGWRDLTNVERWTVIPATVLMFVFGIYPQAVVGLINPTVINMIETWKF